MGAGAIVTLLLAGGVVWGTFHLLGGLIRYSTLTLDRILWPLSVPFRRVPWHRRRPIPYLSEISIGFQFLVGIIFFFYFIFQVQNQQTRLHMTIEEIFEYTALLLVFLAGYIYWQAARYRRHWRHFSRTLFYHRFIKPIWDWVTFQSYALLWLHHIPLLHPVIDALDEVAKRIKHRRWQTFLRCLLFLSLFTLPVKLLPDSFYFWLGNAAKSFPAVVSLVDLIEKSSLLPEIVEQNPWLQEPVVIFGAAYLYLFDWVATVVVLYITVTILSLLEPRNLFDSVAETLQYFVDDRRIFAFTCYFWRIKVDEYAPTIRSSDREDPPIAWEEFAATLHAEAARLDGFLPATWQGSNNRILAVFEEEPGPTSHGAHAHGVHYRRFGESAFAVAVDSHASWAKGSNTRSQADFLQLSESIGALVNVRHSLKYGGTQSVGIFW